MDLLHNWALFRLLFVFLIACPFLIVPVLFGLFKKHPESENRTEAEADQHANTAVSGQGTWNTRADSQSPSIASVGDAPTTARHAA